MTDRYPPVIDGYPHILHGGDYNPDQWLHRPDIIDEDFRLMEIAGCNTFSVGIFAWASLEPAEGEFNFEWLDAIMDRLADADRKAFLATPSGGKPRWMSAAYPEIRRVTPEGRRQPHYRRHNHCPTSPVYREKVATIDGKLAQRYADHPALGAWHLSNEYSGECHCDLCMAAFQAWLKDRYGTLEALNRAWWSRFWSETVTAWDQITHIDPAVDCMVLDWKRFVTHQTTDFMRHEIAAVREHAPNVPVTTNFMGTYHGLDYWRMADEVDFIADDCYPLYHEQEGMHETVVRLSFIHDMMRTMKGGRPWVMMESAPSATNWMPVPRLKRPGVHRLEMTQAVAHGADATMYFQWRKGRGAHEKFHGAVVDHVGHENTRVFQDVAEWGRAAAKLGPVVGTTVRPEVAIVHDWDARWALETSCGPRKRDKDYVPTCQAHYRPFWEMGVPCDVIESTCDLEPYRLVVAPMLFLLKPGVAERLAAFVRAGGTLVATYLTGVVDEANRCWLGGWPGDGLRELFGVWAEEIDGLYDEDDQAVRFADGNPLGIGGTFAARHYADRVHAEDAEVLAVYEHQFYAGEPAVTMRREGDGRAIYVASRNSAPMHDALYGAIAREFDLRRAVPGDLPGGVTAQIRTDGQTQYVFLLNFTPEPQTVDLGPAEHTDVTTGEARSGSVQLGAYGTAVLARQA